VEKRRELAADRSSGVHFHNGILSQQKARAAPKLRNSRRKRPITNCHR
jgi:hypothetical protein